MVKYQIRVTFTSETQLSKFELETLEGMVALQIEEPTDFQGEELDLVLNDVQVSSKWSIND